MNDKCIKLSKKIERISPITYVVNHVGIFPKVKKR